MKIPSRSDAKAALQQANGFISKHLLWIVFGACVILAIVFGRVVHMGNKVEEAIEKNPPLPPKVAAQIIKQSKADSAKAKKAVQVAAVYKKKARVDSTRAVVAEAKADSIHVIYQQIPAGTAVSFPELQRYFDTYHSPVADTSR